MGGETNRADYGLRVNADDVLATGLFSEHFNTYDVHWFGQPCRTIFYLNEKAYDAPDQAAVQDGDIKGFAAYKVAASVTDHEGWGPGSYCNDTSDSSIRQDHGFGVPETPGVKLHSLSVVSLGGMDPYEHVVNRTGSPTSGSDTIPSTVVSYP